MYVYRYLYGSEFKFQSGAEGIKREDGSDGGEDDTVGEEDGGDSEFYDYHDECPARGEGHYCGE